MTPPPALSRRALATEIVFRLTAILALGWYAVGAWQRLAQRVDPLILLVTIDHTLNVLLLVVARLPRDVDRRPHVVALTIAVTAYPALAVISPGSAVISRLYALFGMLGALLFELSAKLALGRSFGLIPANRGLVRGGPYRLVRHPMYLGYLALHGFWLLAQFSARNAALYAALVALVAVRIVFEERLLERDPAHRAYAERTRYRLLPWVW